MPGFSHELLAAGRAYRPYGSARELFRRRDAEIILDGPAGTGKSRAVLEKVNAVLSRYGGARAVMLRKHKSTLTQTARVTFERLVLPVGSPVKFNSTAQEYRYPNGSVLATGGLDEPDKVMSSEWDIAYVQEATEIPEAAWEALSSRMRYGAVPYQQLIGDANPQGPRHWIKLRAQRGDLALLATYHRDNPRMWDHARGNWTPYGRQYIERLDKLTGVRRKRLRDGIWAAAEGMVYEGWDPEKHVIARFDVPEGWRRFRTIDFGFVDPFVCQWWAIRPEDGALIRYRELYYTGQLVQNLGPRIVELSRGEQIEATIADHDAEDRATLLAGGVATITAQKNLSRGIQYKADRLANGKLLYMEGPGVMAAPRDGMPERDPELDARKLPACTVEEYEG
jgi:phage terminase large subunit